MASIPPPVRSRLWLMGCALGAMIVPWAVVHAGKPIHEHSSVDPQGSIEIVTVAGRVELAGWDRPEIDVTGTAGDGVERIDVTTSGTHSSIHVVSRSGLTWGNGREANLMVHVPAKSAISVSAVSADLLLKGLQGDVTLQTVSGDVSGEVGGDLHANTVSGDVRLATPAANRIEVKTVSGDLRLSGGGGEVEITTISGDMKLDLKSLKRGRFKSVSGDLTAGFAFAADGQIEAESVSGTLTFNFATAPGADFDVQSFSGDISNCFGPKPVESRYGPGSRLTFKNGGGRVHIETKSGDVRLCAGDSHGGHSASLVPGPDCRPGAAVPAGASVVASRKVARIFPLL
jgi:hypothetical protein